MKTTSVASTGFLALAGLHVVWATGSSWPLSDEGELLDEVVAVLAARLHRRPPASPSPARSRRRPRWSPAGRAAGRG